MAGTAAASWQGIVGEVVTKGVADLENACDWDVDTTRSHVVAKGSCERSYRTVREEPFMAFNNPVVRLIVMVD